MSPTGSAHRWQYGLGYKECRLQIYIDKLGLRNLVQPLGARDPGVINQDGNGTERGLGLTHQPNAT